MNITVEFSPHLQQFLIQEGYTHVLKLGASEEYPVFSIEILKPGDKRISQENLRMYIEDIEADEITEMAYGYFFINFWAVMPIKTFEKYLHI